MKIIVDAMGGDNAPEQIVKGCALAAAEYGVDIVLCGNEEKIREVISQNQLYSDRFSYVDTGDRVIVMEDHAECVVREKKDSSMAVGMQMLKNNEGDAFITAGNSGAALVGATLIVKRIKGVKRAAIGSAIPTLKGHSMLIDCGANSECKAEYLEQFAVMGSAYMEKIMGVKNPKVGLLNNGAEETKGTDMHVEAYQILKNSENINFSGNVEGRNAPMGEVDVIVADGFSGNIFLKTFEGVGLMLLKGLKSVLYSSATTKLAGAVIKKPLKNFMKRFDYSEQGGAPLLGVNGVVIKAHGSSDAVAIKNAVRQSIEMVKADLISAITASVEKK